MNSAYGTMNALWWRWAAAPIAVLILSAGLLGATSSSDLVAPAGLPDGPTTFDIPLSPCLAEIVVELKMAFVEGVAFEAMRVATEESSTEATSVVDAAKDMSAVANRITESMETLGGMDPTCGIPGLSPLMPMQGAVRETLFGQIVWHESVTGKSRPTTDDLERMVTALSEIGTRALRLGRDIDMGMEPLDGGETDYSTMAESATRLTSAMSGLLFEAAAADTAAVELEQLVWEIRDGAAVQNQARLDVEWEKVQMAASEIRRLAARIGPAVDALSSSNRTFVGLTRSVAEMSEQVDTFSAQPAEVDGAIYMSWNLIGASIGIVEALETNVLGPEGGALPEESLSRLKGLIRGIVRAEGMLAERAVEFASTNVARADDRFETKFRSDAGYDSSASQRQQDNALDDVAARFRRNSGLQTAHTSARACRAWLADGNSKQAAGHGSEIDALTSYSNAWSHALIAGTSADLALVKAKLN